MPKAPFTGFEIYEFFTPVFEENPLFSDLNNHLPAKFRDIMEKWEHYKELRQIYYNKQQEIIEKITDLISNTQKEESDYKFPAISVYLKTIELITGNEYYYYKKEIKVRLEPLKYKLFYEKIGEGIGYSLSSEDLRYTEEEVDNIKIRHEEISNIMKKEYKNDVENLIYIENKIKNLFKELKDNLNTLIVYPEYNNMTCEYIFPKT